MPSLFVSHGAPTLAIEDGAAHRFLKGEGAMLPRPRAILVVSAHFDAPVATLTAADRPRTIHDFRGFPDRLYDIVYAAPGAPEVAREAANLLSAAGIDCRLDAERGLDHGAWVPLSLAYPAADIPVLQLSLCTAAGADHHLRLGEALRPLRDRGVLILGSGGATHNLREFFSGRHGHDDPPPAWVSGFADWVAAAVEQGRIDDLQAYRSLAADGARNHPSEDHFLPLFAVLGTALPGEPARRVHHSYNYAVLAMDAYAVGEGARLPPDTKEL
ncbi:MAG: dioxygenase [Inquilinus sp.]|nr:dioxygenase [Inquilinus sp.]